MTKGHVRQGPDNNDVESVGISRETLANIVLKARAFDVLTEESDPDEASDFVDDNAVSVLEDQSDNPAAIVLSEAIEDLDDDEQFALVALVWIGRGDFDAASWDEAKSEAADRRKGPTSAYLMQMPLLGDLIEEGAAALGISLSGPETTAMYGGENPDED
ncbi:MAG: DUF3775 domain-containing protein [Hyphomonadaceae bacterium]